MKIILVKFFCNAGHTEEELEIEVDESEYIDSQIETEFHKWLDNNEDCGWEILNK